ncbi:60S ribosomal protein L18a-like protein [Zingiber officinale]|uniref:60S ribosomal protein L18a-like protein n=1 Tax=Zingiber officinale TaxID=94328 RepID=UPI001C4B2721|nr:60S ribosomal protein L18a-like protein [Zingiber officinale]XP_042438272.1 60S ribosomal protein L18a-like protein [Zingiber officinale]
MSEEEGRSKGQYGTFQGAPDYAQPAIGFPQPVPPPGLTTSRHAHPPPPQNPGPPYYVQVYQAVPGYAPVEGRPVRLPRLACCGLGIGWLLFILGFFLAAIPWYVGAFIMLCVRVDYREKPGLVACTIAAVLAAIAVIIGATKGADVW